MSHVHRLHLSDRVPSATAQDGRQKANRFFVSVNLRRALVRLSEPEYDLLVEVIGESRQKLHFLFLGYVLIPQSRDALIWPAYPLTISRVIRDIKWISARSLNRKRHTTGPVWQHQFWDSFVRHAQEFRESLDYMHLNPVRTSEPEVRAACFAAKQLDASINAACDKLRIVRLPMSVIYWHGGGKYI